MKITHDAGASAAELDRIEIYWSPKVDQWRVRIGETYAPLPPGIHRDDTLDAYLAAGKIVRQIERQHRTALPALPRIRTTVRTGWFRRATFGILLVGFGIFAVIHGPAAHAASPPPSSVSSVHATGVLALPCGLGPLGRIGCAPPGGHKPGNPLAPLTCKPAPGVDSCDVLPRNMCKSAPTPVPPNRGLSGWIDTGSPNPDKAATGIYGTVEYPPSWQTYDLGCASAIAGAVAGSAVTDPGASMDNLIGNWIKGMATLIVAVANVLHRLTLRPNLLGFMDRFVQQASHAMWAGVAQPWLNVVLALVGLVIIAKAHRWNIAKAATTSAWCLVCLTVATGVLTQAVNIGHAVDRTTGQAIESINANIAHTPRNADPSASRAELLTDTALYREWLRGELGTDTGPTAQKYGRRLLEDQTLSYADQATIAKHPGAEAKIVATKERDFTATAATIQTEDPAAYRALTGQDGSRIGAGALSLFAAVLTAPFMIAADLVVLAALLLVRFVLIFAPVVAVVAMIPGQDLRLRKIFEVALTAVVNAVLFSAAAAVDLLFVQLTMSSGSGLPAAAQLALVGIVTFLLWMITRPLRNLGRMVGGAVPGSQNMNREIRKMRRKMIGNVRHHGDHGDHDGGVIERPAGQRAPEYAHVSASEDQSSYTQEPDVWESDPDPEPPSSVEPPDGYWTGRESYSHTVTWDRPIIGPPPNLPSSAGANGNGYRNASPPSLEDGIAKAPEIDESNQHFDGTVRIWDQDTGKVEIVDAQDLSDPDDQEDQ